MLTLKSSVIINTRLLLVARRTTGLELVSNSHPHPLVVALRGYSVMWVYSLHRDPDRVQCTACCRSKRWGNMVGSREGLEELGSGDAEDKTVGSQGK
jgi:hypothetical protein